MPMVTRSRLPIALALAAGLSGLGSLADVSAAFADTKPEHVAARVDGTDITDADIAIATEDLGDQLQQIPEAQRRDYVITMIADLRLGAKAARAAKFGDDDAFNRKLAYRADRMLFDDYLGAEAKKAVTETAMRALYDQSVKTLKPEEEVRARHILVPTEEEAKAAIKRIAGGEDFAKVAAELSKDPGSGKEGGDLGYFTKERMVPEFATAAFALEPGKISEPVKSQFGYHVIKVEDKRTKPVPTFEEVKEQIEQYMVQKSQQDIVMALRAAGKIERLDPPAAAPAQPAAPAQ